MHHFHLHTLFLALQLIWVRTETSQKVGCIDESSNHVCRVQSTNEKDDAQQETGAEMTTWKWDLDSDHHCNIRRIKANELTQVFKSGRVQPLYYAPIIIQSENKENLFDIGDCDNAFFHDSTSLENIPKSLPPHMNVTLTSSNSHSSHRRIIPLETYLDETTSNEVFPWDKSNETWYLFGETYSKDWQTLLQSYCLPPCETCSKDLSALSFGIGGRGSGVQVSM